MEKTKLEETLRKYDERYHDLSSYLSVVRVYDEEAKDAAKEVETLEPLHEVFEELTVFRELAAENPNYISNYNDALAAAQQELDSFLWKDEFAHNEECLVEIRPGVGGDESCIFTRELLSMYTHYADAKKWKMELINCDEATYGLRFVCFKLRGIGCYSHMKFEAGVHRIQRVPETEAKGRIHTSTATVAVLPVTEAVKKITIRDEDIIIQVKHARGKGGQAVNKHSSAIRMYHEPTGLVVESDAERSQKQNIDICKEKLQTAIYQKQVEEAEAAEAANRSNQVGGAKRSEKFRTYNEPQHRVTQHEDGKSSFNYEKFMNGAELDEFHFSLNRFRKGESCIW